MENKVKKRYWVAIGIIGLLIAVGLANAAIGEVNDKIVLNASIDKMEIGKNSVYFEKYIYVRDLAKKDPEIEAVSYYDVYSDSTIGFVNIRGGLGKNFLIIPGKEYEIIMKEEKFLSL